MYAGAQAFAIRAQIESASRVIFVRRDDTLIYGTPGLVSVSPPQMFRKAFELRKKRSSPSNTGHVHYRIIA